MYNLSLPIYMPADFIQDNSHIDYHSNDNNDDYDFKWEPKHIDRENSDCDDDDGYREKYGPDTWRTMT